MTIFPNLCDKFPTDIEEGLANALQRKLVACGCAAYGEIEGLTSKGVPDNP
jgi:hypothetical protein